VVGIVAFAGILALRRPPNSAPHPRANGATKRRPSAVLRRRRGVPQRARNFSGCILALQPRNRRARARDTWSITIVPLKRGGLDRPSNMQWQTVADAKAKDRVE
jgi:hypothetical protein